MLKSAVLNPSRSYTLHMDGDELQAAYVGRQNYSNRSRWVNGNSLCKYAHNIIFDIVSKTV